jgi:hypothetical protein
MSLLRFADTLFPERGSRTPSGSRQSTPTYATVKRGEEWGSQSQVFLMSGIFQPDTQTPTPQKITFGFKDQSLAVYRIPSIAA